MCYPKPKFISDISDMFRVASIVHIGVGTYNISISVSLFSFGRIGIAVTIGNISKLILGMVLRGNRTLSRDRSFNRSSIGRDRSSRSLLNRNCRINDINVIIVDFNNRCSRCWFRCRFYEAFLAGAEIILA